MITNLITVGHLFWCKYDTSPEGLDMAFPEEEHQELGVISIESEGKLTEHYYEVDGIPTGWDGYFVEHGMTHTEYTIQTEEPLTIGDITVHGVVTIEIDGEKYESDFNSEVIESYVV